MNDVAPDVIGTVRGYRNWRLHKEDDLLHATYQTDYIWRARNNEANCSIGYRNHLITDTPGFACVCGLHAMYTPVPASSLYVDGVIETQGGIVLHEEGIRARYADIVALHAPTKKQRKTLARNYPGVPLYWTQRAMLRAFPATEEICGIKAPPPATIPGIPRWVNLVPLLLLVAAFAIIVRTDIVLFNWVTTIALVFWAVLMYVCVKTTYRRL